MRAIPTCCLAAILAGCAATAPVPPRLLEREHFITVRSTAPAIKGQEARLFVREVVLAPSPTRLPERRVVILVHGAGAGSGVFDVGPSDYRWMAYLAEQGFDAFAVDLTGYGHSTRPAPMEDPCNLVKASQTQVIPKLIPAPCEASHPTSLATTESEGDDIAAVVDFVRRLRGVEKVSLIGWSQGGPRIGAYAARHPHTVERLFALAPAYWRGIPAATPDPLPGRNGIMLAAASDEGLRKSWSSQAGCEAQFDPGFAAQVWSLLLATERAEGKWAGIRRAPHVPTSGFDPSIAGRMKAPFAVVAPQFDKTIPPQRVRELFDDLGSADKVLIDLACSSHNAMWERNRGLLFRASAEWLKTGTIDGQRHGVIRLGY